MPAKRATATKENKQNKTNKHNPNKEFAMYHSSLQHHLDLPSAMLVLPLVVVLSPLGLILALTSPP